MSVIEDVARDWPAFFAWPPSVRCAVTVLTTRTVPGEVVGPLSAALARLPPGDGGGPVLVHEVKGTWEAASAPVRRMLPWARHPERVAHGAACVGARRRGRGRLDHGVHGARRGR